VFTEADSLRGAYGPYRANNDLLYYHLDVRVDPEKQFLSGKNSIRFKMLQDGTRIQLDLIPVIGTKTTRVYPAGSRMGNDARSLRSAKMGSHRHSILKSMQRNLGPATQIASLSSKT
jgi:hypothetical protein